MSPVYDPSARCMLKCVTLCPLKLCRRPALRLANRADSSPPADRPEGHFRGLGSSPPAACGRTVAAVANSVWIIVKTGRDMQPFFPLSAQRTIKSGDRPVDAGHKAAFLQADQAMHPGGGEGGGATDVAGPGFDPTDFVSYMPIETSRVFLRREQDGSAPRWSALFVLVYR